MSEKRNAMIPQQEPVSQLAIDCLIDEEMKSIEDADREAGGIEDIVQLRVYLASLAHAAFELGRSTGVQAQKQIPELFVGKLPNSLADLLEKWEADLHNAKDNGAVEKVADEIGEVAGCLWLHDQVHTVKDHLATLRRAEEAEAAGYRAGVQSCQQECAQIAAELGRFVVYAASHDEIIAALLQWRDRLASLSLSDPPGIVYLMQDIMRLVRPFRRLYPSGWGIAICPVWRGVRSASNVFRSFSKGIVPCPSFGVGSLGR